MDEKPITAESAPSDLGRSTRDQTDRNILGEIEGDSLEEPYGYSRGEHLR